jgi:hypothetical protein
VATFQGFRFAYIYDLVHFPASVPDLDSLARCRKPCKPYTDWHELLPPKSTLLTDH